MILFIEKNNYNIILILFLLNIIYFFFFCLYIFISEFFLSIFKNIKIKNKKKYLYKNKTTCNKISNKIYNKISKKIFLHAETAYNLLNFHTIKIMNSFP